MRQVIRSMVVLVGLLIMGLLLIAPATHDETCDVRLKNEPYNVNTSTTTGLCEGKMAASRQQVEGNTVKKATTVKPTATAAKPKSPTVMGPKGALNVADVYSRIAAPAPRAAAPAPVPNAGVPSGRSSGTARQSAPSAGVGVLSTGVVADTAPQIAAAPEPPPVQTFDDWKRGGGQLGDSGFMAEDASAEADYQALLAQLAQQNSDYQTNARSSFRNLGLRFSGDDFLGGTWDPADTLGAYGSAYQNLQNDYSGRGLLDSTFYGQAQQGLTDRFNRQRSDLVTDWNSTNAGFQKSKTDALATRQNAQARALAEAYARYAGNYGA